MVLLGFKWPRPEKVVLFCQVKHWSRTLLSSCGNWGHMTGRVNWGLSGTICFSRQCFSKCGWWTIYIISHLLKYRFLGSPQDLLGRGWGICFIKWLPNEYLAHQNLRIIVVGTVLRLISQSPQSYLWQVFPLVSHLFPGPEPESCKVGFLIEFKC